MAHAPRPPARTAGLFIVFTLVFWPAPSTAETRGQSAAAGASRTRPPVEWALLGGGGSAMGAWQSAGDRELALGAVSWAWTVTDVRGEGPLAGRLSLLFEAVPIFVMFQRDRPIGAGITPIFLRWTFERPKRVQPFLEISGGAIATNRPIPEGLARFNFTAHSGIGVRVPLTAARALLLGYRFHHISNGYRLSENPSVNSNFLYAGIAFRR
jgi:hypothetical protein